MISEAVLVQSSRGILSLVVVLGPLESVDSEEVSCA